MANSIVDRSKELLAFTQSKLPAAAALEELAKLAPLMGVTTIPVEAPSSVD